jgi:6-phosphogluconolactonase
MREKIRRKYTLNLKQTLIKLETIIKISQSPTDLVWDLARELEKMVIKAEAHKTPVNIALSGGSTPRLLFTILGDHFSESIHWKYIHFFWGDERCVPPQDIESNWRMTDQALFGKIDIPAENIHRIKGEEDPEAEAVRYSEEILMNTSKRSGLPVFDLIILGLGEDGHTASIFPGQEYLLESDKICEVAYHPVSGQKRITLTGRVINNADAIIFLVTGAAKAEKVSQIIENPGIVDYPAASIEPVYGSIRWYLDLDASSMLSQWA